MMRTSALLMQRRTSWRRGPFAPLCEIGGRFVIYVEDGEIATMTVMPAPTSSGQAVAEFSGCSSDMARGYYKSRHDEERGYLLNSINFNYNSR